MKFAMIPINRRYNDAGERIVRRILISYTYKARNGRYKGTKIIDTDPYFKDPTSSQKYVFKNTYFIHLKDAYDVIEQRALLNNKRHYMYNEGLLLDDALEFEAVNLEQAIEIFKNREEKH